MRDILLGQTVYFNFTTRAFASGVPTVLAGTPALSVLESANATPITAGVSVEVDRASVVGLNQATVVATAANGYEAGKSYSVYISTGTVGGVSVVGEVVAQFTVNAVLADRDKYAGGAVWIGPTANTNTVSYVDGIITNPVSTIAAAKTIADALNLRRFYTIRTGTTQIAATMAGYDFDGAAWACTTTGGSQDVGTSSFHNASVTGGTFAGTTGAIWWEQCEFATGVSVGVSNMWRCTFAGTTTLSEAGNYDFIDCASIVAGTAAPVFAVPAGTVNISFRRWSGGLRLTGLTAGTTVSIDMISGGTVTLEGTGATVVVRGMATGVTNSMTPSAGTVTTTAVCNQTTLATPTNITAGTITTVSGNVDGSVASVTAITASGGIVSADIKKVNAVAVTGTGALGDEWGP